jgi:hypothetical protein
MAAHVHRAGDERAWWQATGVEPGKAARKLSKHTRVKEGRIRSDQTTSTIDSERMAQRSDPGKNGPA